MGMPYMGQSFPTPKSGGGGGFAFRVFGGLADIHRQRMGHELTKDLIEHKIALQSASDLILGGQESHLRREEIKTKARADRTTNKKKAEQDRLSTTHSTNEGVRKERETQDVGLETLRTMTADSRPGVDENGKVTPPKIDAKVVRSPLEFQATGATPPRQRDPQG